MPCRHEFQPDIDGYPYCRFCGKYAYSDTYKPLCKCEDKNTKPNKLSKAEALLQAVRNTSVGSDVIIYNSDMQIWCILRVITKEHNEDKSGPEGFNGGV